MIKPEKRALVAAFANPSASPRPRLMIERARAAGYKVSLFSLPPTTQLEPEAVHIISPCASKWKWRRRFAAVILVLGYQLFRKSKHREKLIELAFGLGSYSKPFVGERYDILIVEDLFLLPYCLRHSNGARILFDAREYYPKQREGDLLFELFELPVREWACKNYLLRCSQVFTVSTGISEAYQSNFGVKATVLRSTPPFIPDPPPHAQSENDTIRMVHLGVANKNRQLENMIEIFSRLKSGFSFDMYLSGNNPYILWLQQKAKGIKGINILPPVAPSEIIPTLKKYDVGLYYLEPKGFNLKYSLPNKFFEFIQARLAIAIGPSPEMARLVDEFQCGFVAKEFTIEAMVETLNGLDRSAVNDAQKGSRSAAESLCAENEWKKVDDCLRDEGVTKS